VSVSRIVNVILIGSILAGCSGSGTPPVASGGAGTADPAARIAASAHRALAVRGAVPKNGARRPAGLSAFPAPLSAFPAIGAPTPVTAAALCASAAPAGPGPTGPGGPGPGGPGPGGPGPGPGPGAPAPTPTPAAPGQAGCPARINLSAPLQAASTPVQLLAGLQPGWIQYIYNLPALNATDGAGQTIAVVVAYDDPVAEADLAVYRNAFGLPPCTTANGCFRKIATDGTTNYPATNTGWAVETSTDLDTISAMCPACNILLVEAASSQIPDLAAAVDSAAAQGANVISNSYGVPEAADNVAYDSHYNHPGVAIVVAAGDLGYGPMFPASSEYVTAVGGTSLYQSAGGISEIAWSHTSAGCSAFIPKPNWQHDKGCAMRTMNDVAVVADPATGMAVYDSILYGSSGGWTVIGGTSIGAPIVSALIAMGKHPSHYAGAQQLYDRANQFFSITAGSDGTCATPYFCNAGPGYNGPTGVGSPNGDQAFNG